MPGRDSNKPRLSMIQFTMTIDMQDGRRFSGTFSSAKHSEQVIAVISRAGTIYMVDDDGWTFWDDAGAGQDGALLHGETFDRARRVLHGDDQAITVSDRAALQVPRVATPPHWTGFDAVRDPDEGRVRSIRARRKLRGSI